MPLSAVHYGRYKHATLLESLQPQIPYYRAQLLAPSFIYGCKHAILFQMALLPLTMCRYTISTMSDTVLNRYIPFNRATRMHVYLGYATVVLTMVAGLGFFLFYGSLCGFGVDEYCDRMTSEIMITGYLLLLGVAILGATSYLRHRIPYEIFYTAHQVSILFFILTVAHTLDGKHRSGTRSRSQCFSWVTASMLFYICDRAYSRINRRYQVRIKSSAAVAGSKDAKMVILSLTRPTLFDFKPGQYAFLRIRDVEDSQWHPFSIASGPDSSCLDFYIEVSGEGSWTSKLWNILSEDGVQLEMSVELMGPFGTGMASLEHYSHALTVGTGTGIVPMISMLQQHVAQLLRTKPQAHKTAIERQQKRIAALEAAEKPHKMPIGLQLIRTFHKNKHQDVPRRRTRQTSISKLEIMQEMVRASATDSDSIFDADLSRSCNKSFCGENSEVLTLQKKQMKKEGFQASRSIYGVVLLSFMPAIGAALVARMACTQYEGRMVDPWSFWLLCAATLSYQAVFAALAVFVWDGRQFLTMLDCLVVLSVPALDWFWYSRCKQDTFTGQHRIVYILLTSYMTLRCWWKSVRPRHRSWRESTRNAGMTALECFEFVWISRSAALTAELVPVLDSVLQRLLTVWNTDDLTNVLDMRIYVTDKDSDAVAALQEVLAGTHLDRLHCIHVGRPDLQELIDNQRLDRIASRTNSYSLLAFCGSTTLAHQLHESKISTDMISSMTGSKRHQMEFVSENYGSS